MLLLATRAPLAGRRLCSRPSQPHHRVVPVAAAAPERATAEPTVPAPPSTSQQANSIVPFRPRLVPSTGERLHIVPPRYELDSQGRERLRLEPAGWSQWQWQGHSINWVAAGDTGPPIVLIHGYGGSAYHFRYSVPALAKHSRVYALDMLGFGWSDKPLIDYSDVWPQQIADFVQDVVGEPAVLVGHSLGGYSALHTAALEPQVARGVVLLNAAGGFERPRQAAARWEACMATSAAPMRPNPWGRAAEWARDGVLRALVQLYYRHMKQPGSIKQALQQLYVHKHLVDEDLVRSVAIPAADPAAGEVVFLLLKAAMSAAPLNQLLESMADSRTPLLLLWGDKDPWTLRDAPQRICEHYPAARLECLPAGHCPMDDAPGLVNSQLLAWLKEI